MAPPQVPVANRSVTESRLCGLQSMTVVPCFGTIVEFSEMVPPPLAVRFPARFRRIWFLELVRRRSLEPSRGTIHNFFHIRLFVSVTFCSLWKVCPMPYNRTPTGSSVRPPG